MLKKIKLLPYILGIAAGIATVIGGFVAMDTSSYFINDSMKFGADFYTQIYKATLGVGHAINYAINDLIFVVAGLLLSVGAAEICFFSYKLIDVWPQILKVEAEPAEQSIPKTNLNVVNKEKNTSPKTPETSPNNTSDVVRKESRSKEESQNMLPCPQCGEDLSFMGWDDNDLAETQICPLCGKEILLKQ